MEKIHFFVSGKVQGVGFRYSTRKQGESLGLTGWVRNVSDGRVEVMAEGDTLNLEALIRWCRQGPPGSRVDELEMVKRTTGSGEFPNFVIDRT